jgi:hypothetical protein
VNVASDLAQIGPEYDFFRRPHDLEIRELIRYAIAAGHNASKAAS